MTDKKDIVYWEDSRFSGTEYYYNHMGNFYLTDGIKYMAEKLGAYRFLDIIYSYRKEIAKAGDGCGFYTY